MAGFSIQDAAFTGFAVVRRHRGHLAVWAALALIVSLVLTVTIVAIAGPDFMRLQALGATGSHDPAVVFPLLARLAPVYLVMTPAIIVFYGVLYAAMNRAVLRPTDLRFAYLGFGADEFRQSALLFIGAALFFFLYIAILILVIIASILLNLVVHAAPAAFGLFAVVVTFFIMAWLAVRLSLASALTFEQRRMNLFGSWALTRGRFWPIAGVYLLVVALASVILFLTWLVILATVAVATAGNLQAVFAPANMESLRSYFTVAHALQLILGSGVSALLWPVVLTPAAAILRQISTVSDAGIAVSPRGFT